MRNHDYNWETELILVILVIALGYGVTGIFSPAKEIILEYQDRQFMKRLEEYDKRKELR